MLKRLFDLVATLVALSILWPIGLLIAVLIAIDSRGGVFYRQERVGKNEVLFRLFKFRTMHPNKDVRNLTLGDRDPRVTRVGYYLRKYKLDEFPQLLNILLGEMSIVGPRPEVPRYVALYSPEQKKVLDVRPGLTDYASLEYVDESELLAQADDPEKMYIETIMPHKLTLNLRYISEQGLITDLRVILKTLAKIVR